MSKGDLVYADDGTLKFSVIKIIGKDIYLKSHSAGTLRSSKGINVPHVNLKGKLITTRDKAMIKFAIINKVDFVGISFVESSQHVKSFKSLIKNRTPIIVAQIENQRVR